ncbi:hypothetical protein Q1695_014818 [Nippostrongylus brasiliensis]|nr:hypothetical protein Q1695_014818 [Nippostrongylus brasiliensis]
MNCRDWCLEYGIPECVGYPMRQNIACNSSIEEDAGGVRKTPNRVLAEEATAEGTGFDDETGWLWGVVVGDDHPPNLTQHQMARPVPANVAIGEFSAGN